MLAVVNERPIAADLFTLAPDLRLIGGRNRQSGRIVFPLPSDRESFERVELPHRGPLWSYTVQRFEPKSPPYFGEKPFQPFAVGGSDAAGKADTVVTQLGLTTLPFINVLNGCATGGAALFGAYSAIKSGEFDLGVAMGFDKHPRGAFASRPEDWGLPAWYGEAGMMITTQFFAMKLQRYMKLHGISEMTLARVAEKAYRNGAHAEHAWRRSPVDVETILNY